MPILLVVDAFLVEHTSPAGERGAQDIELAERCGADHEPGGTLGLRIGCHDVGAEGFEPPTSAL